MQHIFTQYFGDKFITTKTHHTINISRFGDVNKSRVMRKKDADLTPSFFKRLC
jgi:hypothetical protein